MSIAESRPYWPLPDFILRRDDAWHFLARELGMPSLLATPPRAADSVTLPARALSPEIIKELCALIGPDRVRQDVPTRTAHARSRSLADLLAAHAGDYSTAPDAVLFPLGEADVLAVLKYCASRTIGVVAFGGGGGMAGGVTAAPGRISLDLAGMDRVLAIDMLAASVTAEAGITLVALEKAVAARGMTLGIALNGTLGGWIAQSRQGDDGLYGARMAGAHGVLAFDTPQSDIKSLVLGSEGTLGVITQATLRIRPIAAEIHRAYFLRDIASGIAAIRAAPPHLRLALSDGAQTRFARQERKRRDWRGDIALLWRRFDTHPCLLDIDFANAADAKRMDSLVRKLGGFSTRAVNTMILDRQGAMLDHGAAMAIFETRANWSKLPLIYTSVVRALEMAMQSHSPRPGAHGLVLAQITDGNPGGATLCITAIFARVLNNEFVQAQAIAKAARDAIAAHGGSLSHQGVGEELLPWMEQEKGALGLKALRGLKQALDPENILNPGKLIPV